LADPAKSRKEIEKIEQVKSTKLLVMGQGVARTGFGTVGVGIMGVEPSIETRTSPLVQSIVKGRYLEDGDGALAVLGSKLAQRLHLKIGKKMVITTNDASGALTEQLCRVVGIFETGTEEVDNYLLQTPIAFTRTLFNLPPGSATQLGVILTKSQAQRKVLKQINASISQDPVRAYPWQAIMPELASYIRVDKGSNLVFQGILLFLILFTIYNTILMSVVERQKEFAVLLALGTPPSLLKKQVFTESVFLGLIGCGAGIIVGGLASYALQVWGFDLTLVSDEGWSISGVGISPIIHAKVTVSLLVWMGGIVLGVTLLLSLFPMKRAAGVPIVDTLR
ncbi:MAG: ABC transporter permease, partial [Deltaproteobacteria bacterium]|nr:ABC transporter permease [Deltaproteobacteria bacterium]